MVGEVRDQETAEICLRAALTGHLVLSTLHTNDALSAVNRLEDMKIEAFLLASTLRLLQAQRLIRRLCVHCKKKLDIDPTSARRLSIGLDEIIYGPTGCKECSDSGYRGRVGIFEIVRISGKLREQIQAGASWKELFTVAKREGVDFLVDSGIKKAREGLTSVEEVLSVALAEEE